MGNDINAWPSISRTNPTLDEQQEYIDTFNLKEAFDELKEVRKLNDLILFFAIRNTEENVKQLEAICGIHWRDNFVKKLRLPDNEDDRVKTYYDQDGVEYGDLAEVVATRRDSTDYWDQDYGVANLTSSEWDETMYCYFPKPEFFKTMNNETASVILALGLDMSLGTNGDSWFKSIVTIIFLIVIAYFLGPHTALAYFSTAIQIAAIVFEIEVPLAVTLVLSIATLATTFKDMTLGQMVISTANLALEVATVYQDMTFQDEVKKQEKEQKEAEELYDAIKNEKEMRFIFGTGFFHSYLNDGIRKDPNTFYYDTYNEFSIYKNTLYNPYLQIE